MSVGWGSVGMRSCGAASRNSCPEGPALQQVAAAARRRSTQHPHHPHVAAYTQPSVFQPWAGGPLLCWRIPRACLEQKGPVQCDRHQTHVTRWRGGGGPPTLGERFLTNATPHRAMLQGKRAAGSDPCLPACGGQAPGSTRGAACAGFVVQRADAGTMQCGREGASARHAPEHAHLVARAPLDPRSRGPFAGMHRPVYRNVGFPQPASQALPSQAVPERVARCCHPR